MTEPPLPSSGSLAAGEPVLLKHLNALLFPDEGQVLIDGRNIFDLSYVDLRIVRQKFGRTVSGGRTVLTPYRL